MPRRRQLPNIILTGTPGVGKTTTCEQLVSQSNSTTTPLKHVDINQIAKKNELYTSYDAELQSHVIDEDRLLDEVEKVVADGEGEGGGGWVIDYHVCDIFPERWIDLVVVLRCPDTQVFFERMRERGYGERKSQENIDAEIFGVVADEARDGYRRLVERGAVVELESVDVEQVDGNCERILEWVEKWVEDHKEGEEEEEEEEDEDEEEGDDDDG